MRRPDAACLEPHLITWTSARSALALAAKYREPDERIAELRTALAAARAYQVVADLMAVTPPPTAEQRRELIAVLSGGSDSGRSEVAA